MEKKKKMMNMVTHYAVHAVRIMQLMSSGSAVISVRDGSMVHVSR